MAAFCLPKKYTSIFLQKLRDGTFDPDDLVSKSSAERRALFAEHLGGDENAKDVNTLFEEKLLLPNRQKAMISWANSIAGLSEPAKRDIVKSIQSLGKVLDPVDEQSFLADLAAKRLGATITADEAKQIFQASSDVEAKLNASKADPDNVDKRIEYGRSLLDLRDTIEEMKPGGQTFIEKAVNVASIPKSMLTSILHFSAPFVQNWGMMTIGRSWEAFGQMFKYFADEDNFRNLQAYIISHPDYQFAIDGKLGLTDLSDKLSNREESIQSSLVEQFNRYITEKSGGYVPNLVRMSSRAFVGFLNYVRFNRFTDLLEAARSVGEDVRLGSPVVRDLAKVVNDFTGRGALGPEDSLRNVGPLLNSVFFSPRKISATMEMFNPYNILRTDMSPTARNARIRQLSGSLIATAAVLGLAKAMGAQVNFDPRSQNFAKIQIGDEKLDVTGSNAIYIRLLARLATGTQITSHGKEIQLGQGYKPTTRADLVLQYIRDKLSPTAGAITDALYGSDPVGRPFSVPNEIKEKTIPIVMKNLLDYWYDESNKSVSQLPVLSAIFGVGVESPLPPLSKSGLSVWGDPVEIFHDPVTNELDKEASRLGFTPQFPGETIKGVQLTDKQYHAYVALSGHIAKSMLMGMVNSPNWQSIPDAEKKQIMQGVLKRSKTAAQSIIEINSLGSDNDIFQKANDNKEALFNQAGTEQ